MVPVVCTTQVTRALSRLTQQFKNQPNCQAILKSLLAGVPEVETVAWSIINQRILANLAVMVAASQDTADQLDILGSLVGEPRQGRTDAKYLPAIQIRIRVNRSQGRTVDIIEIMRLLGVVFQYTEDADAPMSFRIDIYSTADATAIARLIGHARAAGVDALVTFTEFARAPVVFGGNVLQAAFIWGETNWAEDITGTDLTMWASTVEAGALL